MTEAQLPRRTSAQEVLDHAMDLHQREQIVTRHDLADLPEVERDRIEAFFRVYKDLPKGRNPVQLNGYGDAKEAKALIRESLERVTQP